MLGSLPTAPSLTLASLLILIAAPVLVAQPITGPYSVRPGTIVTACGGLLPRCEVLPLTGSLVFEQTENGPAIASSNLEMGSWPFPAPDDLQLTELLGSGSSQSLTFDSPGDSFQGVHFELGAFEENFFDDKPEGLIWNGFYDEGCCDRFVISFGNVVLRPEPAFGALAFHGRRFSVDAFWRDASGGSGQGTPVQLDDQSGYFWFFEPKNPELFVKVLDACEPFGFYWVFVAGLTNLEVDVTVADERVDFVPVYNNPLGRDFVTVIDTQTFECEPPPGGAP